jgi:uncharacterized membrane protein YphA (DoxX/SURF4 family)
MSVLNLDDYSRNVRNLTHPTDNHLIQSQKVRTIETFALVLDLAGLFIPFVADVAAFFMAKAALNMSRGNLVPIEYEKPAWWAHRISVMGILLWLVMLIGMILLKKLKIGEVGNEKTNRETQKKMFIAYKSGVNNL